MPFGDKKSLFYKNVVNGGCKTKKSRFLNRFKSCFDTASLKISTRAFRIRIQISKRSILRRVMVILLQEKNFGPNVRYYVLGHHFRSLTEIQTLLLLFFVLCLVKEFFLRSMLKNRACEFKNVTFF